MINAILIAFQFILLLIVIIGFIKPSWVVRWGKRRNRAMVVVYFLVPLLILPVLSYQMGKTEGFNDFKNANQLWQKKKYAESINVYERMIRRGTISYLPDNDDAFVRNRIIDYQIKTGNLQKAKKIIRDSIEREIELKLTTKKGRDLYGKIKEDMAKSQSD